MKKKEQLGISIFYLGFKNDKMPSNIYRIERIQHKPEITHGF